MPGSSFGVLALDIVTRGLFPLSLAGCPMNLRPLRRRFSYNSGEMERQSLIVILVVCTLLTACGTGSNPTSGVAASAYIQNVGSDTIVNLALAWAERYQQEHPEVRISVSGGGSGTGIAALINGTVDIANASRQIKQEES